MALQAQPDTAGGSSRLDGVVWLGPSVYLGAVIMFIVGLGMVGDPLAPETTVSKIGWFLVFGGVIAGVAGLFASVFVACLALRLAVRDRGGWGAVAWNAVPALSVAAVAAGAELYSLNQ